MMPATGVDKSLCNRIQPVCEVLEHDASICPSLPRPAYAELNGHLDSQAANFLTILR